MKFLVLVIFFAFASCGDIDLKTFDWSSVKRLPEIKEWSDAHPNYDEVRAAHPSLPQTRSRRILNGDVADRLEYPYVVGVLLHYDAYNSWCGGSLISRNFVLTAAVCVHVVPSASVLVGASNMNNIEDNIRVSSILVHPQFNAEDSHNDIATLELSRPAELSATVGLVRLPNRRQVQLTFEGRDGVILGWGRTEVGETQPIPTQLLRTLRSPVITNLACRIRYPNQILESNICTNPAEGTPCEGDQGGPLMVVEADGRRTQIGIFSFQFTLGCGLGWPAAYARVTSFLDFIASSTDVTILEDWE